MMYSAYKLNKQGDRNMKFMNMKLMDMKLSKLQDRVGILDFLSIQFFLY